MFWSFGILSVSFLFSSRPVIKLSESGGVLAQSPRTKGTYGTVSGLEGQPERAWMKQVFVSGCTCIDSQTIVATGSTTPLSQGKESEASLSWHFFSSGSMHPTQKIGSSHYLPPEVE